MSQELCRAVGLTRNPWRWDAPVFFKHGRREASFPGEGPQRSDCAGRSPFVCVDRVTHFIHPIKTSQKILVGIQTHDHIISKQGQSMGETTPK